MHQLHTASNATSMAIICQLGKVALGMGVRTTPCLLCDAGASSLAAALELCSNLQRLKLAQQLQQLQQESGLQLKQGSWTQQLVADINK